MWSKFGEGWKRKGGVEVGEKWRRHRAVADGRPVVGSCRPVDERIVGKLKGAKEERKGKRKEMGDGAEVMDAKDDLNEANTKLFIG